MKNAITVIKPTDSTITNDAIAINASQNPVIVYLASLQSKRSPRVMQNALRNIVALSMNIEATKLPKDAEIYFSWQSLRYQHVQAIKAALTHLYKPATVNRHLAALRGVLKECWRLSLIDIETYNRAVDFRNVRYNVIPAGRNVSDKELRQILLQCYEDGKKGMRDLAILAVLSTTGVRREELAQLDLSDFDNETGSLHIFGKGHKERIVYVMNKAYDLLLEWLAIRGDSEGALFTSINKGGKVSLSRMPATSIYAMLTNRAKRAGLKKITPHDLRRTFVGDALDAGIDAVTITKLTGHSDMKMLKLYDRRNERVKQEAASKIDLPI